MSEHAEAEIVREFDPVMLPPGMTVMMAARHMRSRNASAVLVVEGDADLVGIFTERDAIRRVLADGKDPATTNTIPERQSVQHRRGILTTNPPGMRKLNYAVEEVDRGGSGIVRGPSRSSAKNETSPCRRTAKFRCSSTS